MDVINERFTPPPTAEEAPEPQQPPTEQG